MSVTNVEVETNLIVYYMVFRYFPSPYLHLLRSGVHVNGQRIILSLQNMK